MEKEHGSGTLTRELTMMPVWKSLSEGETSNPQDYQEESGGFHRPGKRASSQYPDWKGACFVCMK